MRDRELPKRSRISARCASPAADRAACWQRAERRGRRRPEDVVGSKAQPARARGVSRRRVRRREGGRRASKSLTFRALAHLTTRDLALVLERTRDRMTRYLRRRGLLEEGELDAEEDDTAERAGLTRLAASAVPGVTAPAGPEWRRGALPVVRRTMVFERPLCVALDGFTLHAATRAGGGDGQGREALLKYILRPAVAQERVTRGPER